MPLLWLVDPDAETIEAFVLESGAERAAGASRAGVIVDRPRAAGPGLAPAAIWPPRD